MNTKSKKLLILTPCTKQNINTLKSINDTYGHNSWKLMCKVNIRRRRRGLNNKKLLNWFHWNYYWTMGVNNTDLDIYIQTLLKLFLTIRKSNFKLRLHTILFTKLFNYILTKKYDTLKPKPLLIASKKYLLTTQDKKYNKLLNFSRKLLSKVKKNKNSGLIFIWLLTMPRNIWRGKVYFWSLEIVNYLMPKCTKTYLNFILFLSLFLLSFIVSSGIKILIYIIFVVIFILLLTQIIILTNSITAYKLKLNLNWHKIFILNTVKHLRNYYEKQDPKPKCRPNFLFNKIKALLFQAVNLKSTHYNKYLLKTILRVNNYYIQPNYKARQLDKRRTSFTNYKVTQIKKNDYRLSQKHDGVRGYGRGAWRKRLFYSVALLLGLTFYNYMPLPTQTPLFDNIIFIFIIKYTLTISITTTRKLWMIDINKKFKSHLQRYKIIKSSITDFLWIPLVILLLIKKSIIYFITLGLL